MSNLTALEFKKMLKSGVANLSNCKEEIDSLNVFPVPDGDTGTNMSMTVENGLKEVMAVDCDSIGEMAKIFSKGLLMGARGNSGVITSQIFRGLAISLEGKKEASPKEIAEGFENGARVAYKAIMKPVEGTILTVIKEGAWYANHDFEKNSEIDIKEYFTNFYNYAKKSLDHTPELLPILKEVGVVDSGGAGLVRIIEGFKAYFDGAPVEFKSENSTVKNAALPQAEIENDEFGYCTEFILRLDERYRKGFDENILKKNLTKIGGESLVVVKDEDLVKVHVHMLKPGEALNMGQRYGEFIKLKIENMKEQHSTIMANAKNTVEAKNEEPVKEEIKEEVIKEEITEEAKPTEPVIEQLPSKKYGVIAVGIGDGICDLLRRCNCDIIVSGGQTMNPSTEDFVNEVKKLSNCQHVLIFPNNSNIILAARQVADVFTDRNVHVVDTKSIPACISCLSGFDPDGHLKDNLEEFERVLANFEDASVTYASKDTIIDGLVVNTGDTIAMTKHHIVASGKERMEVIYKLLDEMMMDEDKEIMTVFIGADGNNDEAALIEKYVTEHSDIEVEIFEGGQPVYTYLLGLE